MRPPIYINQIEKTVNTSKKGTIFVPSDFYHITNPMQVGICLTRLCKRKMLERFMRGVYVKPGRYSPGLVQIACAVARSRGWTAVPCGETALFTTGISYDSPKTWTFLCDGKNKSFIYGNKTFEFKHTGKKDEIAGISYNTALCIQALRAVGKDNITEWHIRCLAGRINLADKRAVLYGSQKITSWVRKYLKMIMDAASKNAPALREDGYTYNKDGQNISTIFGYGVKSKSEALIAAHLHMAGLEFKYETLLVGKGDVPMRPDFKIKHKGNTYYWEHLGMEDDVKYLKEWQEKKKIYDVSITDKLLTTNEKSDVGAQILKMLHDEFEIDIAQADK